MTEPKRNALRIGALAIVVLAVHLWLLGALPRIVAPANKGATFIARTVAPPKPPQIDEPRAAPQPRARVAPPPLAPRKQEVTPNEPRTRTLAAASSPAPSASVASAPRAGEPASATREAGAAPLVHVAVAPSARYHYEVTASQKGFTLHGSGVLEWHNAHGEYEAQLSWSSPLPFVKPRTQRSVGLVTSAGLEPVRFSDKTRSEEAAHFDRENGKVVFSTNKPEAALEPGAQDRLSIVMQLSALLAGEPSKYRAGSSITVQTASTKEAEPWTFTVEGTEVLDLPGGRMQAVRLLRNPRKEYDTKVELWLAPGSAYAPVRLRLTQPNGDWVDQQWSSTDRG
ncbi:MAG TPA: DUF3108 domain-containing protein [Ramlibacter sp.]